MDNWQSKIQRHDTRSLHDLLHVPVAHANTTQMNNKPTKYISIHTHEKTKR